MNVYIIRIERHLHELEETLVYHHPITAATAVEAEDAAWDWLVEQAAGRYCGDEDAITYDRDRMRVQYEGTYDHESHTATRITRIDWPNDVLAAMAQ